MRFELSGYFAKFEPLVVTFTVSQTFDISFYRDIGYTHFEVICIGAGGGQGGGINTNNTGTLIRNYGGAGGGGGFHRVKGLLDILPSLVPIVVGVGGTLGTEHASDPAQTTDGGDGGYSSFNGTTCRASGGKGGKKVTTNSLTLWTFADGGQGGIGDSITAGGGGLGGTKNAGMPETAGADGLLVGNIGAGGGGGHGGVGKYGTPPTTIFAANTGGRGAYNVGDLSVAGYTSYPGFCPNLGVVNKILIIPGGGTGAKATPLNGLPKQYGYASASRNPGQPGVVVVRLTAE